MPLLHEATLVRVDMIFCRFLESDVCSECNRAEYVYIRPRRTLVIVGRRQAKSFSGSKSKCVVSVTHPFPYSHVAAGGLPTAVQSRPMVYSTYSQLLLRTISCNSFLASLLSCWSSNIYSLMRPLPPLPTCKTLFSADTHSATSPRKEGMQTLS